MDVTGHSSEAEEGAEVGSAVGGDEPGMQAPGSPQWLQTPAEIPVVDDLLDLGSLS